MSYKEKPLLKLYKNQNNSFELQAIIDDYESCSFQRNNYEAGQFSIEINYNIPNSQLFQEGLFIQFGNDSKDFGVIKNVRDSVGPDGRGSQIRNITGYDVRYIFKQRIIKDLNFGDSWTYSGSGELCMRNLIKSQCGDDAEQKRRLPVINNIPEIGIGSDYTVSEAYSNLYDVLVTIATQTEVGWYIEFKNGNLILQFTSGVDRSKTVRFDTDFNSLSDGTYEDSSESFANTVYVGGKGSGINKDIYEGEIKIEDEVPSGLDRFECWDNSSTLDNENDYKNEAVSKLIEYGQTVSLSGTGLAKCPYVYKEEYDVGDIITVAFTGKTAISRIISLTEYWSNGEYDIEFEFGKPIQDLNRQLSILISKIQTYQATAESSKKSNVRYYSIPSELEMPKEDVILDVIGFVGDLGSGQTFNLWFDNENKTGAKTYHVYFKELQGSGKLTLTTGVAGSSTLEFDPGTYVSIIYVDADGNVSKIIGEGGAEVSKEEGNAIEEKSDGIYVSDNLLNSPIGTILPYMSSIIPGGFLLCDGSEYKIEDYPKLYEKIRSLPFTQSENEGYFKVPDLKDKFVQGANENLGESIKPELPNIKGSVVEPHWRSEGTFSVGSRYDTGPIRNSTGSNYWINFDASKGQTKADGSYVPQAESVYKNGGKVQPPAVTVNFIIKATSTIDNLDEIIDDTTTDGVHGWSGEKIQAEVQKGGSTHFTKEEWKNKPLAERIALAGSAVDITDDYDEPENKWEDKEVTFPYTATKDGILHVTVRPTSSSLSYLYLNILRDGNTFLSCSTSTAGVNHSNSSPIKKGDVISINTSSNASVYTALVYEN